MQSANQADGADFCPVSSSDGARDLVAGVRPPVVDPTRLGPGRRGRPGTGGGGHWYEVRRQRELEIAFDSDVLRRLNGNWIRTASLTAHSVLVGWMLLVAGASS